MDALVGLPAWVVLLAVFAVPAAEASLFFGMVIPGETAVLVGGAIAHAGGLPLWAVIAAAVAGAIGGDQVGYWLGRRFGPSLIDRFPARMRRTGRVQQALDLVARRGFVAVLLGRWTAVLRALVPAVAGASGMSRGRFTLANAGGGATWATTIALLGYAAGAGYRALEHRLGVAGALTLAGVLLAGVLAALFAKRKRQTQGGGERGEDPAEGRVDPQLSQPITPGGALVDDGDGNPPLGGSDHEASTRQHRQR